MKITQGYTLSQFIDCLEYHHLDKCDALDLIRDYNNFLNEPLSKEMFSGDKAIFDGNWRVTEDTSLGIHSYKISDGVNLVEFFEGDDIIFADKDNYEYSIKTLYGLFVATEGKLKLKNVDL